MIKKRKQESEETALTLEAAEASLDPYADLKFYTRHLWRDTVTVFMCAACSQFRNDRDSIIEHILLHYPQSKRGEMLDVLLKQE